MLEIVGVAKRYRDGVQAIDDLTLTVRPGVLGLLGANGAGKTTLLQMIATVTRPTAGTISYDGVDVLREPDRIRQRLGYLPQDFGVYENLSAFDFLSYFAALKGIRDRQLVMKTLEIVNLHGSASRIAATFSGGMRQRLGIAQAIINNPSLLIVDEPTAGLDPEERVRFRNILADVGSERTVIFSTHIVSDIESIATEIAVLAHGRLVHFSSREALLARAAGSVWSVTLPQQEFEAVRGRCTISRSLLVGNGVELRIVQRDQPFPQAIAVEPDLEDAYLAVTAAALPRKT